MQHPFVLQKTILQKNKQGHTLLNSMCDMLVIYLFNVKYITGLYLRTCRLFNEFRELSIYRLSFPLRVY